MSKSGATRTNLARTCAVARYHEIARRLGLAEKTVRYLTSSVLVKLGVPDRTAAALRAREAGLDEDPSGRPGRT